MLRGHFLPLRLAKTMKFNNCCCQVEGKESHLPIQDHVEGNLAISSKTMKQSKTQQFQFQEFILHIFLQICKLYIYMIVWAFLVAQTVKKLPAMLETQV